MAVDNPHSVGLRELRHDTGAIMARVQQGETIDVTQRGRLIARITPVPAPEPSQILERLHNAGRLRPAVRPGYRPSSRDGDGTDRLADALASLRAEQSW